MVPTTAQRTIDIHKSAPRPRAKPMLAKAAKATRMLIRTKKRMSTWVDRSSRDRFGSWATTQNSGVGGRGSAEIVAADRLVERVGVARYRGRASAARRWRG